MNIRAHNNQSTWVAGDKLKLETREGLECIKNEVQSHGGTTHEISAWRPQAYQRHLYDIYKKYKDSIKIKQEDVDSACWEIIKNIRKEWEVHGPLHDPAKGIKPDSHSKGEAFDIRIENFPDEVDCGNSKCDIDDWMFIKCSMYRFNKIKDPVHWMKVPVIVIP